MTSLATRVGDAVKTAFTGSVEVVVSNIINHTVQFGINNDSDELVVRTVFVEILKLRVNLMAKKLEKYCERCDED